MMTEQPPLPWYKHFWPWFIVTLLGTVVTASFITLYISIKHSHSLVKDDYYKEGLAINKSLKEDELAKQLGIAASLSFNDEVNTVQLTLRSQQGVDFPDLLKLEFIHPSNSENDFQLPLQKISAGHYQQAIAGLSSKRWYLQLHPVSAGDIGTWRIRGNIDLTSANQASLSSATID